MGGAAVRRDGGGGGGPAATADRHRCRSRHPPLAGKGRIPSGCGLVGSGGSGAVATRMPKIAIAPKGRSVARRQRRQSRDAFREFHSSVPHPHGGIRRRRRRGRSSGRLTRAAGRIQRRDRRRHRGFEGRRRRRRRLRCELRPPLLPAGRGRVVLRSRWLHVLARVDRWPQRCGASGTLHTPHARRSLAQRLFGRRCC